VILNLNCYDFLLGASSTPCPVSLAIVVASLGRYIGIVSHLAMVNYLSFHDGAH
jgi:hypothetical protein